jgi:hypothetical protein
MDDHHESLIESIEIDCEERRRDALQHPLDIVPPQRPAV